MQATPEQIWPLISDISRQKAFTAETFDMEWLDGATGPALGVRFRGHVKRNGRGPVYWSVCTIDAFEPNREFAFTVGVGGKPVNRWRYQLAPNGGGTDVTESFELRDQPMIRLYWALLGWARRKTNVENMRTTLQRMKAAVEAG
jgi:hypothetical protein